MSLSHIPQQFFPIRLKQVPPSFPRGPSPAIGAFQEKRFRQSSDDREKIPVYTDHLVLIFIILQTLVHEFQEKGGTEQIIVLEDDLLSSPFFLKFMNEGLEYYKDEDKVISINGYLFPVIARLPETFFLKGADCWGWATWKRGWDLFEPDGEKLLGDMRKRHLKKEFDFNGAYPYTKMLEDQTRGKNNSWAIRWYASAFLNDKLTLYPGRSLTKNIGTDASGTHCGKTDLYESQISLNPIEITDIPIEENRSAREEFGRFMKEVQPGLGVRVKSMATNFFTA